jgi:hypothetical protein
MKTLGSRIFGYQDEDGKILTCVLRNMIVQDHVHSNFWDVRINIDYSQMALNHGFR